jgi:23S rRNA pseudouridine1911/1915/1917 synthase
MIIFENNNLLVVNKPAAVTVEDLADDLKDEIKELKELPRYGLAHRLDKDTSGVLLFGKDKSVLEDLKKKFKERKVNKKYICLVWRKMKKEQGKIITSMRRSKNDK